MYKKIILFLILFSISASIINAGSGKITLISPEYNYISEKSPIDLTFTARAFDSVGLKNCTLWALEGDQWVAKSVKNISGILGVVEFKMNSLSDTHLVWNVECTNRKGVPSFSDENRFVNIGSLSISPIECDPSSKDYNFIKCGPKRVFKKTDETLKTLLGNNILDKYSNVNKNVACVSVDEKKTTTLSVTPLEITEKNIPLPRNYEVAIKPFNLECNDKMKLTLSIPEKYSDLKVLECNEQNCFESKNEIKVTSSIICGGKPLAEIVKDKRIETVQTLNINEISKIITKEAEILPPYGKLTTEGASLTVSSINNPVYASLNPITIQEVPNKAISLVSSPVEIRLINFSENSVAEISMDIPNNENIDPSTVVMLSYDNGWNLVNAIQEENKLKANIAGLLKEDHAIIALAGSVCNSCKSAKLEMVYNPPNAKDAVILVHGLFSSPATFDVFITQSEATSQPYAIYTFGYPYSQGLEKSGIELADNIETVQANYNRISILAHSAGGIVIQYSLKHASDNNYNSIKKISKIMLAGVPNRGIFSPEIINDVVQKIISTPTFTKMINTNAKIVDEVTKKINIPRVPSIGYNVIAGTKDYGLPIPDDLKGKIDGIVSTASAQSVGETPINTICKDYFELDLTHTELIDEDIAIQIIARQLFEDNADITFGRLQYLQMDVPYCDSKATYWVIGKPLAPKEIAQPLNCGCGNGVCGVGEDINNCEIDCKYTLNQLYKLIGIIFISAIIIFLINHFRKKIKRKKKNRH